MLGCWELWRRDRTSQANSFHLAEAKKGAAVT